MQIKSIKLQNFGNIKEFQKTFTNNLTILSGDNGNGKSTVLKAFLLNAFDSYTGVLADYINWSAKSFSVEVEFTHKGSTFLSYVQYDGSSTERTLTIDGGDMLRGDEAKRKLKEILDPDLLKAAALSLEQEVDIVTAKPADRRNYLQRIYNLDYKQVIQVIQQEAQEKTVEQARVTGEIKALQERTYEIGEKPVAPFSEEQYDSYKQQEQEYLKQVLELQKQKSDQERLLVSFEALMSKEKIIKDKIQVYEDEVQSIQKTIDELPVSEKAEQQRLAEVIQSVQKEVGNYEETYKFQKKTLEETFNTLDQVQEVPAFDEDAFILLKANLSSKRSQLQTLKSAKDVCPTCGQSISSPEHIAKRNVEIEELETFIEKGIKGLDAQEKTRKWIKQLEVSNQGIREQETLIKHKIETLNTTYQERMQTYREKLKACQQDMDSVQLRFAKEQEHLNNALSAAKTVLLDNQEFLASVLSEKTVIKEQACNFEDVGTTLRSVQELLDSVVDLLASYSVYKTRKDEYDKRCKAVEIQKAQDQKEIEALQKEVQLLSASIADAEVEVKILKTDFPVYVISRVVKDIEYHMNEFLKKTYNGRYTVEVLDKNGSLRIVYGAKKQDVSLASGYEKSLFNLAFKIAISKAIGNRCLILDEADATASTKNSSLFYTVLANSIGSYFDQIILVSHKEAIRDMLENEFGAEVITFINGVAS